MRKVKMNDLTLRERIMVIICENWYLDALKLADLILKEVEKDRRER